ncbi:MAG: protein-export chaperone SecB [Alphaproteobacteria bacterium]|jgi:preprotein translocase subunit SecB|nr:protein-export chaperone SecB [Alphaproteobacteria bacterium]
MSNKVDEKFRIVAQYIKDLSFEVPGAPKYFFEKIEGEKPAIEIGVDIKVKKVNDDIFTVLLHTKVNNKLKDEVLFLAEVDYEAVVKLNVESEKEEKEILLIDTPSMIFPFVREIICSLTKDSGFPPIVLNSIDFKEMYNNKVAK